MAGVVTAKVVIIDKIEIVIAGVLVIVEIIVVDIAAGNVIVDAAGNIAAKGKEKRFFRSIGLAGILIGDVLKNLCQSSMLWLVVRFGFVQLSPLMCKSA